ncbi:MAG: RNA polymerase factor sigma-54 [Pirellulaceae bacterium]
MRLSFGLETRQLQRQILAPRMIQSMEILQLPLQELQEKIEQELVENPVLEKQERDPTLPDEAGERETTTEKDIEDKPIVVDEAHNNTDDFERLLNLDREMPDYFDESTRRSAGRIEEDSDRLHDVISNVADRPESLQEYLLHQLGEMELEGDLFLMCERIISTLDSKDGGYFRASLRDLLPSDAPPEQLPLAERALALVQSLDPPGIAARDLRECLLSQLSPDLLFYDELRILIANHLEDLRDNRLPLIERITGYSIETIQETWVELRTLNPKPASQFAETFVPTVKPDVTVERDDEGHYKVNVEDSGTPTLHISKYYRERLSSGTASPEEREYIKRKINAAQWLIESIEQRRTTLTKVSQAIVDHQTKFLDEGPEFIEPLKMQQIADKVKVHVTTVSRAVDDKYIQTPRGIFALKRFFVGGTRTEGGEDVAWDIIRIRLQEVVDREDKTGPLSDDDLVEELKKQGLTVARRTVTKYRQKMGIPSSRQRRDWTKVAPTNGAPVKV